MQSVLSMQRNMHSGKKAETKISVSDSDEDSENEDTTKTNQILTKIFGSYNITAGNDNNQFVVRTSDCIESTMSSKANTCLVCLEAIRKTEAIWCCNTCHTMFHISCIQRWIKDGVYQQSALSPENFPKRDLPWFCPKCRQEYLQSQSPTRYRCFCGKVVDPPHDPWLVPHSCGQQCNKALKPDCGHRCLMLCHPGPCPPCPQTVRVHCYCRRCPPEMKRCGARDWSCNQPCHTLLACGQHKCTLPCHAGSCQPCHQTSIQACLCGREKMLKPCAEHKWQCTQICQKQFDCGNHKCEKVCHAGSCGPCPRSGPRKCPCGKTSYSLPCTEEVPTCLETCDRVLNCGIHLCTQRCHTGPCGMCREMVEKQCKCGKKKKQLQCYKEFQCETKCMNNRDCGRHQCKRKCCDGNCPPCEQSCGKTLTCKSHKCASLCHRGPCYPCTEIVRLSCDCGQTVIQVPCGRQQVTKPPRCNKQCRKPPNCHHTEQLPHRCHPGDCPPCNQICNKVLKCGHHCPIRCHTAIKTRICDKDERQGPWQQKPVAREVYVEKPCAPCSVPLPVTCPGKHETVMLPCSNSDIKPCGRECGRLLACTNHKCQRLCHSVIDATDNNLAGTNCQVCEEECKKSRPEGCTHTCQSSCHAGPCAACKKLVRLRCHCQLVTLHIECDKLTSGGDSGKQALLSCGGTCPRLLSCGHQCKLVCHSGNCTNKYICLEKVKLKCPCKRRKFEYICNEVEIKKVEAICDEQCEETLLKIKKQKEKEEKAKLEEEERKKKLELEENERIKMESDKKREEKKKKKRERREKGYEDEKTLLQKYSPFFIISFTVLLLAGFAYYLFQA